MRVWKYLTRVCPNSDQRANVELGGLPQADQLAALSWAEVGPQEDGQALVKELAYSPLVDIYWSLRRKELRDKKKQVRSNNMIKRDKFPINLHTGTSGILHLQANA